MAEYDDALSVHLDNIAKEGGASFTLAHSAKDGWTATGTRKGGRKEMTGSGDTAIGAVAALLSEIRGVEAPAEEDEQAAEPPAPMTNIATAATPEAEEGDAD